MDLESVKRYLEGEEDENKAKVANLPHRFLERFVTNGLKVDLIKPGRLVCSMKIPPHLLVPLNQLLQFHIFGFF